MIVIPGNHDSRNVGYVHFEELFGDAQLGAARERRHARRGRLDRARPRQRADRPRPLRLDRGAVRRSGRPPRLRPPPPPAAGAGHGPRAEHRQRRRRRARVPPAGGRRPRPLRAQARPVRVAARGSLRRQRRHGLVVAAPGKRAALLQHRRGRRDARRRLAEVPIPRAGAHHPVLDRDEDVREVHGADRRTR